ncbi:MAG: molybdopterin-dependent oxidoreductase [Actinomycetota bacterium]|nr:molybdopterin-dependent oxidoreductase [Actinomycetota bacterium]
MTATGHATVRRLTAGAMTGVLTAAVALGVAELAAAIIGPNSAPVIAVGDTAINLTPIPVKEFAITHFGSHDKEALLAGIVVMLLAFAVLIGIAAVRRIAYGLAGLAVFAAIGIAAAIHLPTATVVDVVPTLAGVIAAIPVLIILVRAVWAGLPAPVPAGPVPAGTAPPGRTLEASDPRYGAPEHPAFAADSADVLATGPYLGDLNPQDRPAAAPDRRRFLIAGAGAAAVAAVAGGLGDKLLGRFSIASSRALVRLPAPAVRAAAVPAGTELGTPGLTPFFTSNSSFYRVDTDLVLPQVSPDSWTLKIDGMVEHELEFSYAELLKMPMTETDITLVCVSNQVGGTYNGNARWLGVPLAGLLRRAGVKAGADQVLSAATDGMTISTPLATIMDGRPALIAVGMNGQPLPIAHGFPARMIVPGLYGYVSATKWLTKLTVTTFAAQKAYWTQRGYSAQAPIKTESRIDVPKPLSQVKAGRVAVAGVAWAPATGIAGVEVNVDGGPWHQATLAAADGIDTWRQWMWAWDAKPGLHTLQVRATDKSGATQTSARAYPVPNGASGWDSSVVTVT